MNLKKYMSRHFIMRLCLMLALVGAATAFDMYHSANQKLADSVREIPGSDETGTYKLIFCNQVPTYNLKTSGTDLLIRFRVACSHDKFLLKHYNSRTFQLMKAETLHSCFPSVSSFHSLPFNRVLYASPDDIPPLS
ncbi:MAG TPA: hypothetical protein VFC65_05260 [Prolixibacteraceae bacterium]|nr:hypothetical protein [Prolixibacteraceae bacterium]